MNIHDYLLPQRGNNWPTLLRYWTPPLPPRFTLWLVNCLGDVFAVLANDAVLRLDVGSGTCVEVARTREDFAKMLDVGDNAERWLRIRLVDACRQSGMILAANQCYGFRIPPTLGGQYEVANLAPTNLAIHYSYQAYICKQTDIYWIPPK